MDFTAGAGEKFEIAIRPIREKTSAYPMKYILPTLVFSCALVFPVAALTLEDFSPEKLKGKTLTFTIESGTAPLATTGSWTGTFETSPANGFTLRNVSGNTVDGSGTWTYAGAPFPDSHGYDITPFLPGNQPATLTLWISEGKPRFFIDAADVTQYGDVAIASSAEADIAVQQPKGSNLTDGKSSRKFGTAKVDSKGISKTFTIKNAGDAKLSGLAVAAKGKQKGDFEAGKPGKTSLAPGASTTFKVTFTPKTKGKRKAMIEVKSNDADENPFEIEVSGEGAAK